MQVLIVPHVRLAKFCEDAGWTYRAAENKIAKGVWLEGYEYHRAPDGSLCVDIIGYNKWVQGKRQVGVTP